MLAVRLGRIHRVSYNRSAWDGAPRHIHIDGQLVRLGGFDSQHTQTLDVLGLSSPCLTLLVIPPETGPATAHGVLLRAARRGNADTIRELVTQLNAS